MGSLLRGSLALYEDIHRLPIQLSWKIFDRALLYMYICILDVCMFLAYIAQILKEP